MQDEREKLTAAQDNAVGEAIKLAKAESGMHNVAIPEGGEAYAYSTSSGAYGERIHWGVNGRETGQNTHRGVMPRSQKW